MLLNSNRCDGFRTISVHLLARHRCRRSGRGDAASSPRALDGRLGGVTGFADRLQVVVVVTAVLRLGHDVIDCHCLRDALLTQARLTQAAVTLHDSVTKANPLRTVSTVVP